MKNKSCFFLLAAAALGVLLMHAAAPTVDRALVGTWNMEVPNPSGVATWIWEVRADGTYDFHAEGPGNIPSHRGTFQAANGTYHLNSTTIDWVDQGTYDPPANNLLRMTGRLGTGHWRRATLPPSKPATVPVPTPVPSSVPSNDQDGVNMPDIDTMIRNWDKLGKGFAEDGSEIHFDPAVSAKIKAKNQRKISYLPVMAAVVRGSMDSRSIVLFYSGRMNMDAELYSDAMVALAGRASFGLSAENEDDLALTNMPPVSSDFAKNKSHIFPRVLIVKPLYPNGTLMDKLTHLRPGEWSGPLVEFEWEYFRVDSAQGYAEKIAAELTRLGS
jgi:hypothetical protein